MSTLSDPAHVAGQYRNSSNLQARMQLHARFSTNQYGWFGWLFDHLGLPPESRILELGCGTGTFWRENANRIPPAWDIVLSDSSPGMLDEARHNLQDIDHPFTFTAIDAQSIPLPNESFDAVIANFMLYHVPDRRTALSEVTRILGLGGRFYAATNGSGHMKEISDVVQRVDPESVAALGQQSSAFTLENGGRQIAEFFPRVTMHRYEDGLAITEAQPLVAYVMSWGAGSVLTDDKLQRLKQLVEQELKTKGVIHVTKASGLFEALKAQV